LRPPPPAPRRAQGFQATVSLRRVARETCLQDHSRAKGLANRVIPLREEIGLMRVKHEHLLTFQDR